MGEPFSNFPNAFTGSTSIDYSNLIPRQLLNLGLSGIDLRRSMTVDSGHDGTFLHFFASELSSFLGRNASCCDSKQLFPRLAGVALHGETGGKFEIARLPKFSIFLTNVI